MKRFLVVSFVFVLAMFACDANAHDSTGCGLGSMAWRDESGPIPQVLAITTNTITGTQTFGITSGTSGCDPNGRISGGTRKMVFNFIENNMEQYAMDSARGNGETLSTLAGMMNINEDKLAEISKENFAVLFVSQDVDAIYLTNKLFELVEA